MAEQSGSPGPATDREGRPVGDPSPNVLDLVAAETKRQDDLRHMVTDHLRVTAELRASYDDRLREAEAKRIDAIRAVDVAAVQQGRAEAETRATALAAQVASSAEAMRNQVAAAATAAATSLAAALVPIQESIADLRRAQYEQVGQKQQVVETRDVRGDERASSSALGAWIFGGVGVLVGLVSLGVALYLAAQPG